MDKFVEVRKLIASKNKKLAKWLPGFVVRYIEHIIHQDEVNEFMARHKNDDVFTFCRHVIKEFDLELSLKGEENIPRIPGSCIFVGNHPLGGLDAIAIIHLFKEVRPDIKFIVNDILMNVEIMKDRFVGVNKVGKNALASLQKVEKQFASDSATFIFPAGLVSRKKKGKITDLEWKKTFVSKAKKYGKPVIPVHISGKLTRRFYRLANAREFLGIRLNIEMFFLVDELYRQKNTKIDIVVGEAVSPTVFTADKLDREWAQWMKKKVYGLKKG